MLFNFDNAICKRCPYFVFKQCHYKKTLYNKVPTQKSNFKFRHRCKHYKNIFRIGQPVLVNIYSQEKLPDGGWESILVYENVPGIIKGFTKNKFIVEFFKAYFFNPQKQKKPQGKEIRLSFKCLKPAKDIRPILVSRASIEHMSSYRLKMKRVSGEVCMN